MWLLHPHMDICSEWALSGEEKGDEVSPLFPRAPYFLPRSRSTLEPSRLHPDPDIQTGRAGGGLWVTGRRNTGTRSPHHNGERAQTTCRFWFGGSVSAACPNGASRLSDLCIHITCSLGQTPRGFVRPEVDLERRGGKQGRPVFAHVAGKRPGQSGRPNHAFLPFHV